MSDFYSATIFLSAFIMIIMDMLVSGNDLMEHDKKQTVYTISVLVIACMVSEWFGVWMNGADPSLRTLHILVKTIELSTAPIITVLCSDLMMPLKHKKLIYTLIGVHAGLEVLSAFFGFIFSVDAQNVYHHETFYWVYVLAYASGVLLFIGQLLSESSHHYGLYRALVIILPVFFFCGLFLQYGAGVHIMWACSAVDVLPMAPLNGCRRWIRFGGLTLQSSEVAKFEMILFSSHLAAKAPQVERLDPERRILLTPREWLRVRVWKQLVVPVLPLVPVVILLALEPHMSGIVLTVAVVGTILLLSGSGGVLTWAGAVTAGALLETLLSHVDSIPYLQKRLDGWTQDLSKMTDQTVQSLYAIGSGGLKGLGLGNSVEKQLWLPESTNDFIFSVVCEELGFIGAVLIIVLFVLFIVQGLLIAYKAENLYCTMVGIGIMAQIAWQVFCNIAVVTNTLPNTGISLPFFSSGGTSLILLLAEMGVMVNIGRNGERVAQQREQMRAQREAARAEREAELARKTIDLASARAARTEQ